MSDGNERRIEKVVPEPGYRLVVTWMDGEVTPIEFVGDIKRGGIWTALQDEHLFSQARVVEPAPSWSGPNLLITLAIRGLI